MKAQYDIGMVGLGVMGRNLLLNMADHGHSVAGHDDPNTTILAVANGGGLHPARNIVGGDFLHLVRLGIRAANDPIVCDSLEVIDRVLKRDLPQGPGWRRYNHDGYGQKDDGSAFAGTGVGRSWPILTGERGHYELAAGRDPMPFIVVMEKFANAGGMISEQLWDAAELPKARMRRGQPTGAAMPLCWSHAEYVSLVRSAHDGICFDRVEPAFQRYVVKPARSRHEIWSFSHPLRRMFRGKTLRIIVPAEAAVVWSANNWVSTNTVDTTNNSTLTLWFADLPTENCPGGALGRQELFCRGRRATVTKGMRRANISGMSATKIKANTAGVEESRPPTATSSPIVLMIGHSTRTLDEFIRLLQAHGVSRVVDVRTVPRSRHNPQFNKSSLPRELEKVGLRYVHLPGLGGLRHAKRDSPNVGWRNASFRGFADYMQTPEFEKSLEELIQLATEERVALMCAEALPWRCHRSLIADALLVHRIRTEDIMSLTRRQIHTLTPFAKVRGASITYPAENHRSTRKKSPPKWTRRPIENTS